MKKVYFLILVCIAALACKSVEKSAIGVVEDASMNVVTIVTEQGDTLTLITTDANKQNLDGLLLGDKIGVSYNDKDGNLVALTMTTVEKGPYAVIGKWIQPIPGMEGVQGIDIQAEGVASSINMATLLYDKWSKEGNTLTIEGMSLGNSGDTIRFAEKYFISKLTIDTMVLESEGVTQNYTKEK